MLLWGFPFPVSPFLSSFFILGKLSTFILTVVINGAIFMLLVTFILFNIL